MRIGLYPGTFDPITLGHIDIIRRGCALVDRLVIGVAINRDKGPLFDLDERVAMIEVEAARLTQQTGTEIQVHPFENLLIDCARDVGAGVILRGLRAVSDFEYEYQMVGMNRALDKSVETVFLMAGLIPLGWAMDSSGAAAWVAGHTVEQLPDGLSIWVLEIAIALLTVAINFVVDWFLHKTSGLRDEK